MGTRILVTGGAGFIGSHIVDRFIALGHEVVVVDDLSGGKRENVNAQARLEVHDIRTPECARVIAAFRPQVICHHAAQMDVRKSVEDPAFDADVNLVGLLRILEAARKAGALEHVIFASSGGAMYGELPADRPPAREDTEVKPESPYGLSKAVSEQYLALYQRMYGTTYTALRYGNVYGPRQNPHGEAGVVAIFCGRILKGESLTVFGDGKQTRDYVFVTDVVDANARALERRPVGGFNVGTGQETDVLALARGLVAASKKAIDVKHAPARQGEQQRSVIDPAAYGRETGWKPTVPIDDGLAKTYAWFRDR
jgi:UDP-glucose 4-epimerase